MIYELNHFGIVIRDLEVSLAFYQGVLGARIVYRGVIPATNTDVVYLQLHGGLIELLHRADAPEDETFGITHIAFLSDDLDADFASLVDSGCEPLLQPKVAGTGVGRLAFLSDPNGARVELLERDLAMRIAPIEHPIVAAFDHYSVIANDLVAAEDFYVGRLGLAHLTEIYREDTDVTIKYLSYDYDVLELLHRPEPLGGPIFQHFALRVHDVHDALAACAAHGIPAEQGTPRPIATGNGWIGIIRDPDGVKIELLERVDVREL